MTVKGIFKTLIGTIFLMVSISVIIELFNVSITGMQVKQMVKMSAKQACVLFTQETYKTDNSSTTANNQGKGSTNIAPVVNKDGTVYVTGNFYDGTTEQDIWNDIYNAGSFADFCNSAGRYSSVELPTANAGSGYSNLADAFPDLKILQMAVAGNTNTTINTDTLWDLPDDHATVIAYNNALKAQAYKESMFTPVNLGIPYLDDEIVNKMFRWNVATILSNSDPDSIQEDEQGNFFINYKGFRVYAQNARIKSYKYKVYNLKNDSDRNKFKLDTGISAKSDATSYGLRYENTADREDNYFVTAVEIEYQVPISYIGITPIKNIFNYAWNKEVAGFQSQGANTGGIDREWANEDLATVANSMDDSAADGIEILNATSDSNALATLGKLTYILVR